MKTLALRWWMLLLLVCCCSTAAEEAPSIRKRTASVFSSLGSVAELFLGRGGGERQESFHSVLQSVASRPQSNDNEEGVGSQLAEYSMAATRDAAVWLHASLAGDTTSPSGVSTLIHETADENRRAPAGDCTQGHVGSCFNDFSRHPSPARLLTGNARRAAPASSASPHASTRRALKAQATDASLPGSDGVVYTRAAQIMSVLPTEVSTSFCYLGASAVGLSSSTKFNCTSDGATYHTVDAYEFRDMPPAARSNCTYITGTSPTGVQCICSADYFLFESRPNFFGCLPRNFTCATSWEGLNSCQTAAYAQPEPYSLNCYRRTRMPSAGDPTSNVASLSLRMSCGLSSNVQVGLFQSIGAQLATPPNASNASVPWIPFTVVVHNNATAASGATQPAGTYQQLSSNPFLFPTVGNSAASQKVFLTRQHPLARFGNIEWQAFDFNRPSRYDNVSRQRYVIQNASTLQDGVLPDASGGLVPVATLLAGNSTSALWNISFSLSDLKPHFFYGGRLYIEAGLQSPFGLTSRYSVSGLSIEVSDMAPRGPNRSYEKPLSTGTLALLALGLTLLAGCIIAVAWFIWQRPDRDDVGVPHGHPSAKTPPSMTPPALSKPVSPTSIMQNALPPTALLRKQELSSASTNTPTQSEHHASASSGVPSREEARRDINDL